MLKWIDQGMPEATVKWAGGLKFTGEDRLGHDVLMEASKTYGGEGQGFTPMELLLATLGGCAGIDIVSMLRARGQNLTGYEVAIKAVRREQLPRTFQKVTVRFTLKGDLNDEIVNRVVRLTMTKLCPIAVILGSTSELEWSYELQRDAGVGEAGEPKVGGREASPTGAATPPDPSH